MDVEFVVSRGEVVTARRPVIGVDGPVQGADLCFDHHATGEAVNLLAIPERVPHPGTIATTMLDGDAVISAAVVLLRAADEHAAVGRVWEALHEAAHHCDHLVPSGTYPEAERAGLGLHCWLKERGLALAEVRAWGAGEVREDAQGGSIARPSPATQAFAFRELTGALVSAIRSGRLPCDFAYLERLPGMEARVREAIQRVEGRVTVLRPFGYLDPLAIYRVVDTDVVVTASPLPSGATRYTLGVHPRAYARVDLRHAFARLSEREPGWGGAANRGGSPMDGGSSIPQDELVELLNSALPVRTGQVVRAGEG